MPGKMKRSEKELLQLCGPSSATDVFSVDGVTTAGTAYKVKQGKLFLYSGAKGGDAIACDSDDEYAMEFACDDVVPTLSPIHDHGLIVYQHEQAIYAYDTALGKTNLLTELPERACELHASVTINVGVTVTLACFVKDKPRSEELPIVYPHVPESKTIHAWTASSGWQAIAVVTECAERLCLSPTGAHVVFATMANHIPEEAERGEWFVCETAPASTPHQFTHNAGRVGEATFTADGSHILYTANYSLKRPITTHCPLYAVEIGANSATTSDESRVRISPQGHNSEVFASVSGSDVLFTVVNGAQECSYYIADVRDHEKKVSLMFPATNAAVGLVGQTMLAYVTETATIPPSVAFADCSGEGDATLLTFDNPQPLTSGFAIDVVVYKAADGSSLSTFHCYGPDTRNDAPLLVHAHGGPAVTFPARITSVTGNVRYTYRQLIAAGYRVIMPLFRGTLGFGDEFAQKNINCQGEIDLHDIQDAIAHFRDVLNFEFGDNIGIFGGSYGGYMTLRALSKTSLFKCGVAMYGFVHGRMMSLEGGDPSWEEEYVGDVSVWPLTETITKSDNFYNLGNVSAPTLFLHGADDDICMPSSSLVGYRALRHRGIDTELVMYPGEGHGFDKPQNQRDRDIRVLQWFRKTIPPNYDEDTNECPTSG